MKTKTTEKPDRDYIRQMKLHLRETAVYLKRDLDEVVSTQRNTKDMLEIVRLGIEQLKISMRRRARTIGNFNKYLKRVGLKPIKN